MITALLIMHFFGGGNVEIFSRSDFRTVERTIEEPARAEAATQAMERINERMVSVSPNREDLFAQLVRIDNKVESPEDAYDKVFERFPNLRVASIENGSAFLGDLFVKLEHSKKRMPNYYKEDPAELFREHVWINPFWEDKISDVVGHMGANQVIFGSDWPHMEGMQHPRDVFQIHEPVSRVVIDGKCDFAVTRHLRGHVMQDGRIEQMIRHQ